MIVNVEERRLFVGVVVNGVGGGRDDGKVVVLLCPKTR